MDAQLAITVRARAVICQRTGSGYGSPTCWAVCSMVHCSVCARANDVTAASTSSVVGGPAAAASRHSHNRPEPTSAAAPIAPNRIPAQ